MATEKIGAEQALLQLSSLAADFKVGIVSEEFVTELLTAIVTSMAVSDREALLAKALECWYIGVDDWR